MTMNGLMNGLLKFLKSFSSGLQFLSAQDSLKRMSVSEDED